VPLGTEPGISLIMLPLMRILQRNLNTDKFVFISHTTNILLFKFRCNIFIGVRTIKEMPGSVASGTPCRHKLESENFGPRIFGTGLNEAKKCGLILGDKMTSWGDSCMQCSGDVHVTSHKIRFVLTMTHLSNRFSGDHCKPFVLYKVTPVHQLLW